MEPFLGGARTAKFSIFDGRVVKNRGTCNSSGVASRATGATGGRQSEPKPPAQSHPSTRAGGQDDVSYTNSLKLKLQGFISES